MRIKRFITTLLLLFASFLFSGCAANLQKARSQFSQTKVCCGALSQIEYKALKSKQSFKLSQGKRVRLFDDQASYFQAFKLNGKDVDFVTIRSDLAGSWLPSSYVVIPRLWLLDNKFKVIKKTGLNLSWDSDYWTGSFLKGNLYIPSNTQYILVFAEQGDSSSSVEFINYTTTSVPINTGSSTVYVQTGTSENRFDIPYGPDGKLKIYAEFAKEGSR